MICAARIPVRGNLRFAWRGECPSRGARRPEENRPRRLDAPAVAIAPHVIAGDINPGLVEVRHSGESVGLRRFQRERARGGRASERAASNSLLALSPLSLSPSLLSVSLAVRGFPLAPSRPRPPTPCRRKRGVIDHPARYGRACSGAASRFRRRTRAPRRGMEHAPFKIKTRDRAPIYFDRRALLKYSRRCATLV